MKRLIFMGLMVFGLTTIATANEGKSVYMRNCRMCHQTGMGGAPKTGDKAAWNALIAKGVDKLVANGINGKGRMPPRGGNPNLTDEEVRAAVMYMVEQAR